MSVANGQPANAATFNAAFMDKNGSSTSTTAKADFQNTQDALADGSDGSIKSEGGIAIAKSAYFGGIIRLIKGLALQMINDSTTTGSLVNAVLTGPFTIFTDATLVSIQNLSGPDVTFGALIVLKNGLSTTVTLKNNSGGTAANRILTGTGSDLALLTGQSVFLIYDTVNTRWQVVGGSGSGGGGAQNKFTIADAEGTPTNVTSMLLDGTQYGSAKIGWRVLRISTGGGAQTRAQAGTLLAIFDGTNWSLSDGSATGTDAGVLFTINASTGQILYTSDANGGTYSSATSYLIWTIESTLEL